MTPAHRFRCDCTMCKHEVPPVAYCPYCFAPCNMEGRCTNGRCAYIDLRVGFLELRFVAERRAALFIEAQKAEALRGANIAAVQA